MINVWVATIIAIATLIVGYVAGVYLPHKFRREDKKPKISVGPFQERFNLFEITNHGGDLMDLGVTISWLQDGKDISQKLSRFYNSGDDPLRDKPHAPGSLKKSETKRASECPKYSDNGKVEIQVIGNDIDGRAYSSILSITNEKQPKKK